MKENKTKPDIRFKGFTDDWEQRNLGTLCSLITKGTTPKDKSGNGEVNFVKVENIDIDNGEITSTSKISIAEHEGYLKRSKLKENDILFSIAGTLGRVSVVKSSILPANINQALAILRINEGYIPYLTTVLKGRAVEDFIRRNPTIGAQPNLSLEQVNNLDISYPNYDEQVRIGQYFSNLDNLITLHQRERDQLKELKKTMLKKMFPRDGSNIPEVRFAGFTDDWEQRKLGDIASSFEYGLNSAAKEFDGVNKYIRITDIDDNTHEFLKDNLTSPDIDLIDAENYKLAEGDILFARTGASVGKSYIYKDSDGLVYYAGFLIRARIKEKYNAGFVFQNTLTDKYNKYITVTSQRSGQPGVNAQEYSEFKIQIPNKKEQTKIGQYFSQLDNLITLHQRELEILKNLKKTCLKRMFI